MKIRNGHHADNEGEQTVISSPVQTLAMKVRVTTVKYLIQRRARQERNIPLLNLECPCNISSAGNKLNDFYHLYSEEVKST